MAAVCNLLTCKCAVCTHYVHIKQQLVHFQSGLLH
jgi:hypothetical protein